MITQQYIDSDIHHLYLSWSPSCDIWNCPTSFFKDVSCVFTCKNFTKRREQLVINHKLKIN